MTNPILPLLRLAAVCAALFAAGCGGRATVLNPLDENPLRGVVAGQDLAALQQLQLERSQEYRIGAGDVLAISLLGQPDIFPESIQTDPEAGFIVTDSPFLSLPLIGAIRVHGKTVDELSTDLAAAYRSYVTSPRPIVLIKKASYNQVAVLGSVQQPGRYPLEFGDTLLDALFKAGGVTMGGRTGGLAPARYLKVYRERLTRDQRSSMSLEEMIAKLSRDGNIEPREEIVVPLQEFVFRGGLEYNLPLQPSDIVYVPPAGTAIVMGRVRQPGVVFLGPSVQTLAQVLTERGGLRYGADSDVTVVRYVSEGEEPRVFSIEARQALALTGRDFYVQDGDQVFVHTHGFRAFLETLGGLVRTGASANASATYNPVQ
ncbi:MAG: polysaccharide biosynthesis/export family protein [Candidatus Sumerlaeia bacterium]|nr:polysaccharide biosynthesis/export family protein [Candidatus Sumerlaeia bacterium]